MTTLKNKLAAFVLLATICGAQSMTVGPAVAASKKKVWTIYDRQVELRKKVEKAFKANELTEKESNKLNGQLDDIDADVQKMKEKNAGKLSYKDEGKLEKRLNKVSLDLQKYQLAKRVTVH